MKYFVHVLDTTSKVGKYYKTYLDYFQKTFLENKKKVFTNIQFTGNGPTQTGKKN